MSTPTYTLINQITLATAAGSVTFSAIPQNYKDLVLAANASITVDDLGRLRFNGDAGSNYSNVYMFAEGVAFASEAFTADHLRTYRIGTTNRGTGLIEILDYSAIDKHKTITIKSGEPSRQVALSAHRWANTSAISSLTWSPWSGDWTLGSSFSLYGIVG